MSDNRIKSQVWTYMEKLTDDLVRCLICKAYFKTRNTTSSLLCHLKRKHPDVNVKSLQLKNLTLKVGILPSRHFEDASQSKVQPPVTLSSCGRTDDECDTRISQSRIQTPFETQVKCEAGVSQRKDLLDRDLLRVIVEDMQPVSIVEDHGFRRLVQSLDPSYELPSCQNLKSNMLPKLYQETRTRILEELNLACQISITLDIWKTRNTEEYLTVTAHFITSEWILKSFVLETKQLISPPTVKNIAEELNLVLVTWCIKEKICAVVTDNEVDTITAVEQNQLKRVPCFAHTLNLVVMDSIKEVPDIVAVLDKIRRIVEHFHFSRKSSDKLSQIQMIHGQEVHKLVQDCGTRFNSTLFMLQCFIKEDNMVSTALCQLDKKELCLSTPEITAAKMVVNALEPFEQVIKELNDEHFTRFSKVLPLINSLSTVCHKASLLGNQLAAELQTQLSRHFATLEQSFIAAASAFLDPRFKTFAFNSTDAVAQIEDKLVNFINPGHEDQTGSKCAVAEVHHNSSTSCLSLWADFDQKVTEHLTSFQYHEERLRSEIRRYNEVSPVPRNQDPLSWWRDNQESFPELQEAARTFLSVPATSVPSNRLFSKAGELFSHRRSCIDNEMVEKVVFLNKNVFGDNSI